MPSPTNRGRRFRAEPLAVEEITALISVCSRRAPTGIRNAALLAFLWRTGLRVGEAVQLRPADIESEDRLVRVLHGKGGTQRVSAIWGSEALPLLDRWLDRRQALGVNGHHPVFCTLSGSELDTSYVRHLMPRLAGRASLDRRVHAHALRHTHAHDLMRAGVAIDDIRDQLGHSSIAITDAYLKQFSSEDRIARILAVEV